MPKLRFMCIGMRYYGRKFISCPWWYFLVILYFLFNALCNASAINRARIWSVMIFEGDALFYLHLLSKLQLLLVSIYNLLLSLRMMVYKMIYGILLNGVFNIYLIHNNDKDARISLEQVGRIIKWICNHFDNHFNFF